MIPDYFLQEEQRNGLRLTWNKMPTSSVLLGQAVVPLVLTYNLAQSVSEPLLRPPLRCSGCQAVAHPAHHKDGFTTCFCCGKKMNLHQKLPPELCQSTVEYLLPCNNPDPAVVLLLDVATPPEQLSALVKALLRQLCSFPPQQSVGLIFFGKQVTVFDLSETITTKYCFAAGSTTPALVVQMLGISPGNDPRKISAQVRKRYFKPFGQVRDRVCRILEQAQADPTPSVSTRPVKATGLALSVATSLVELSPGSCSLLLFLSGPCTVGPGLVVSPDMTVTMRSFNDITRGENVAHMEDATRFYQQLGQRLTRKLSTLSAVVFTLDQFGLVEFGELINSTGGLLVMGEQFDSDIFRENLNKLLRPRAHSLLFRNEGTTEIFLSQELQVLGAIGACSSLQKKTAWVSKNQIGVSDTSSWFVGNVSESRSLSFFLEPRTGHKNFKRGLIQVQTLSRYSREHYLLRVTSIQRNFDLNFPVVKETDCGFDQEAAILGLARLASNKFREKPNSEVIKWLDRSLVRFAKQFGSYKKGAPESFSLPSPMGLFPQFLYHLRRSAFVNALGMSPDQQEHYRLALMRENIENILIMVQPSLHEYTAEQPTPIPVRLEAESMKEGSILLFDNFFSLATWSGRHVLHWKAEGLGESADYPHLKTFFQSPSLDVAEVKEGRLPVPLVYDTYAGHSKERILKSRMNPEGSKEGAQTQQTFMTDEISLRQFTEVLIKLAVRD